MILCLCHAVSDAEIKDHIAEGAHSVEAVGRACGAGTDCGSCREEISELIDEHRLAGCAGKCPRQSDRVGAMLRVA